MSTPGIFVAVCKREFVLLSDDNEQLPISNIGAIRLGLEALQKEDGQDFQRASELWSEARKLLTDESQDDEGSGAQGVIAMADQFNFAGIHGNCDWW